MIIVNISELLLAVRIYRITQHSSYQNIYNVFILFIMYEKVNCTIWLKIATEIYKKLSSCAVLFVTKHTLALNTHSIFFFYNFSVQYTNFTFVMLSDTTVSGKRESMCFVNITCSWPYIRVVRSMYYSWSFV